MSLCRKRAAFRARAAALSAQTPQELFEKRTAGEEGDRVPQRADADVNQLDDGGDTNGAPHHGHALVACRRGAPQFRLRSRRVLGGA